MRPSTLALAALTLLAPSPARADVSLAAAPGGCVVSLERAGARFVADIDGDPDGLRISVDAGGVRVTYYAALDRCGVYDDYRARTHHGRVGFRIVDDDGHHAAAFRARLRPALVACLAAPR